MSDECAGKTGKYFVLNVGDETGTIQVKVWAASFATYWNKLTVRGVYLFNNLSVKKDEYASSSAQPFLSVENCSIITCALPQAVRLPCSRRLPDVPFLLFVQRVHGT